MLSHSMEPLAKGGCPRGGGGLPPCFRLGLVGILWCKDIGQDASVMCRVTQKGTGSGPRVAVARRMV